jgi:hypothetical protein
VEYSPVECKTFIPFVFRGKKFVDFLLHGWGWVKGREKKEGSFA